MPLFKNVSVVQYYVVDWEKAKKFYSEVLEWPVAYVDDTIGWMEFGNENETRIAINRWEGPEPVPPRNGGATCILSVESAHATTKALRERGVKCDDAVDIPGVVSFGTFYDPEGNRIQFAASQPPPS